MIRADEALENKYDSALVRLEGRLTALSTLPDETVLILNQGKTVFRAFLKEKPVDTHFPFREGSRLQIT